MRQSRILVNSLGRLDLIQSLKKPEVVPHRIPQLPALKTRAARVDNDHDVLVICREDRVPVSVKAEIDKLCAGSVVPGGGSISTVRMWSRKGARRGMI